jgi:hypothetical protein
MTGPELRQLRQDLGDAIGRDLSAADMAKLCGLPADGADTVLRWEISGPGGIAVELLRILGWRAIGTRSLRISTHSTGSISTRKIGRGARRPSGK